MIAIIAISFSLVYGYLILRREVHHDFRLWKEGKYQDIKHGEGWRRRAWLNLPTVAGFTIGLDPSGWMLFVAPLLCTALVMFLWWLFFDGWFNNIRRFNWWYTGTDDPEDAKADDILQDLQLWQHIALKLGGTLIFITLYIILIIL